MATHILRKSGIGKNRNVLGGIQPKVAHRIIHFLRSGGAIQTNDVDIKHFERGKCRPDFRAQQHRARFLQRHLHRDRQPLPCFLQGIEHAHDGNLGLQQILRGLNEQHIHTTLNEGEGLLFVRANHVIETDMPERRQLGRGPE